MPESVALNGSPCKVYMDTRQPLPVQMRTQVADNITNKTIQNPKGHIGKEDIVANFPWGPPAAPSQPAGNQPISARDGILYGVDGNPVVLQVNIIEKYLFILFI